MTRLLFILSLALPSQCLGQEKLVIGNSNKVSYEPSYIFEELDSLVAVSDSGRITFCDNVEVFYDLEMSQLAYKSYELNDTCYTEDFHRNGALKQRIKYFDFDGGWPLAHYSEFYCKNGQLLSEGLTSGSSEPQLLISYYCNGQKKTEFTRVGVGAHGKMTCWYDNGNVMYEFYFDNNVEVGEWKYYKSDGTLESTEVYENGDLIKTIKE